MTSATVQLSSTFTASALDAQGKAARRVQLLPMGTMATRNGNPPKVVVRDRAHAHEIIAASRGYHRGNDMVFDYDHQSVFGARPGVGGRAEAAGWVKLESLSADNDGIWADVDWTDDANAKLAARQYRYVSPVFMANTRTGEVTSIINATLTNTPNLDLLAVASAVDPNAGQGAQEPDAGSTQEKNMSLAKIAEALGLDAGASEADILGMIADWKTAKATMSSAASALGLAVGATGDQIVAAASTAFKAAESPDPTKFVDKAAFDDVKAELDRNNKSRIEQKVASAIEEGRVRPSQQAWAMRLGEANEGELDIFLASAAPLLKEGEELNKQPEAETGKLTEDERHVASSLGISEADFIAARDAKGE